jgi:uncharacterized protein YeeX (DUF496 family)
MSIAIFEIEEKIEELKDDVAKEKRKTLKKETEQKWRRYFSKKLGEKGEKTLEDMLKKLETRRSKYERIFADYLAQNAQARKNFVSREISRRIEDLKKRWLGKFLAEEMFKKESK